MKQFFRYVLLALVLIAVALISALTAMRFAIHGREVAVPKLVGLNPMEAERVAVANGLLLVVENRFYSPEVPEGRIMTQVPAAGEKVRRGWRVRVAESLGPQRVTIPDVSGQSLRAAEMNLVRRGLEVGSVSYVHLPDTTSEQVVGQSPAPSATGVVSPKVNLLVAIPPEHTLSAYVMPDLVGMDIDQAARVVAEAGLKFGEIKTVASGGATVGTPPQSARKNPVIVRHFPAPGQQVFAGSSVNFEVVR